MQASREGTVETLPSPVTAGVLALVIEQPTYGYQLCKRFGERFGDLHPVSNTRVYQVLNSLESNGLIERLPPDPDQPQPRQPRPNYRATAKGARTYRHWMAAGLRSDPRRDELLRRLLATSANEARTLLQIVELYERSCLDEMAHRRSAPTSAEQPAGATTGRLRDLLIAEEQRLIHESRLKFVAFARSHIQAEIDRSGG